MTVNNPLTGWSQSVNINAGGNTMVTLPNGDAIPENYSTTESKGFHVTATADIQLSGIFTQLASSGATSYLPTAALDTQYIILDYPADPGRTSVTGATVTILATEANTTIHYTPPCPLYNSPSSIVGTSVSLTFTTAGQTLTLMANQANATLSGMEITSDKPIAVFQGNQITGVPYNTPSGDFLYDQSIPVSLWSTEYVLIPTLGRTVGDRVRVVADSACTITLSTGETYTFAARGVQEFDLSASSPCVLTSDKPVSVGLCMKGSDYNAEPGDGSLVMVTPTDRGTSHSLFSTFTTQRIYSQYIAVATTQPATMTLDGNSIASQFHPIGATGYSYARISVTSGTHSLDNSNGTFIGWAYGKGNVESYVFSLGHAIDIESEDPPETSACPEHTTVGDDFWVTFIPNGQATTPGFSVIATGLDNATITVSNPRTGWSSTTTHTGGTKTVIELPGTVATSIPSGSTANLGFHVTSTADISLYASNYIQDSWDICNILPTERLTSQYIVQDYPNNSDYKGAMALVATEDNTAFSMVLPCVVDGLSLPAGSTYTVTLDAGQTLALKCGANVGFSGMTVTSNGKPFALFQGHSCARVGTTDTQRGRDHLMEQAIPLDWWGKEFVVVSEQARTEGDQIRVTASTDNTLVSFHEASTNVNITLNAGETHEFHLPANSAAYITSTGPIYVCKYLISFDKFNPSSLGDPASVDIPPVHNWLCSTTFPVHNCNTNPYDEQYITSDHHYLDIVTTTAAVGSMKLDGQTLLASQFTALTGTPYSYYHGPATLGAHTLDNTAGPFYATVSGHARWVAYAFLAGMSLEEAEPVNPEPQIHRDSLELRDTVCQGEPYSNNGFNLSAGQTATPGTVTAWDSTVVNDTVIHYLHLTLTVLPTRVGRENRSIVYGDTLIYRGDTLTLAGDYTYVLTAANGCDSVVTLHISYDSVGITASADGLCPGEVVTLTAEGTHTFRWTSSPYDSILDSQQGQNPVTVHPETTTVYSLLDDNGNIIASVTVGVAAVPILCIESNRSFIDFDHPVITLHDCSEGRHHTSWDYSDGYHLTGERARRLFEHPLPDTITVTMTSCNQYNCCADTAIGFTTKILSIWFPNIFFPDADNNNRFSCSTSYTVAKFEMTIFNRWGLFVWESNDINQPWDGTHNGTPVPQGAYVYRWYLEDIYGDRKSGMGTITLIR